MSDPSDRPIIFDYEAVPQFMQDMLNWLRKSQPEFTVRGYISKIAGCSPTLVTHIVKGSRRLTRERVEPIAALLGLNIQESRYLDHMVAESRRVFGADKLLATKKRPAISFPGNERSNLHKPQNHLFSHWLNPYIKVACRLVGFKPEPLVIHRLLGGVATVEQIKKSLDYLLTHGFLRKTLKGDVVPNERFTTGTLEVADKRLLRFQKQALKIAMRGLDLYPLSMRRSETFVLAVNEENLEKLKKILASSMDNVEQFESEHRDDNERLYQVTMNLTPVGGGIEKMH